MDKKNVSIKSLDEIHSSVKVINENNFWKKIFSFLGPAYLIGVGYIDPGNWATDLAAGSFFEYKLIWILIISNIIALFLQHLSARLGIIKGMDLAQLSRFIYPKYINFILYLLAELSIIATDLAEVIGMAIGLKLLLGISIFNAIIITLFDTFLIFFLFGRSMRIMELFIIIMITIAGISLFTQVIIAKPNLYSICKGIIPSKLNYEELYISIGIIGSTVMPHNLYLHSSIVQTRIIQHNKKNINEAIKYNFIDTIIALNIAFLINVAIMVLAASVFYYENIFVDSIELAHNLMSKIGTLSPILFAIALIASGQSSTITGTLAGQIVMEGYLNFKINPWLRRIITRSLAILPSLLIVGLLGDNCIGQLLIFSQVVLSLQLGFAIIPLIYFNSSYSIMKDFVIKKWQIIYAILLAIIIIVLNLYLVISNIIILNFNNNKLWYVMSFTLILSVLLLIYISLYPFIKFFKKYFY